MFELFSDMYFIVYKLYYVGQNDDLNIHVRLRNWDGWSSCQINLIYYRHQYHAIFVCTFGSKIFQINTIYYLVVRNKCLYILFLFLETKYFSLLMIPKWPEKIERSCSILRPAGLTARSRVYCCTPHRRC
jgi:hypothetical protein